MPLSAKLLSKSWANGLASFEVKFTDDITKESFTRSTGQIQTPGDNLLPVFVSHVSRAYDAMKSYFDSQEIGSDVVPVSLEPTREEKAADAFFSDLRRLTNMKQMRPANDTEVVSMAASLKSRFESNPQYADDHRWPR